MYDQQEPRRTDRTPCNSSSPSSPFVMPTTGVQPLLSQEEPNCSNHEPGESSPSSNASPFAMQS
jgi:hypothetical protein